MKKYLSLFRWPNILIILLLEYLLKYGLFEKQLHLRGIDFPINDIWFGFFAISTVFVAIAGYIVNDIEDIEIDKINRPDRPISAGIISISQARTLQWFFEIAAVVLGAAVAFHIGHISLVSIHLFLILLLRAYATKLKCKGLLGNLVVAFSTASVPYWVWIYVAYALQSTGLYSIVDLSVANIITLFYWSFAFIFTLIREIVKDLEDLKGDQQQNCKTLAVTMPLQKAKNLVMILNGLAISAILWFQFLMFSSFNSLDQVGKGATLFVANFVSIIVIVLIQILPKVIKANSSYDFNKIGISLKIIMLAGILQLLFLLF